MYFRINAANAVAEPTQENSIEMHLPTIERTVNGRKPLQLREHVFVHLLCWLDEQHFHQYIHKCHELYPAHGEVHVGNGCLLHLVHASERVTRVSAEFRFSGRQIWIPGKNGTDWPFPHPHIEGF